MAELKYGNKTYTEEELKKAVAALERTKEQGRKYREKQKDPAVKAKSQAQAARRRVEQSLIIAKAKAQGITVTKEEVDKALAASKAAVTVKK